MWLYIWLGVIVLAVIVEFATSELVSIWFIGGGLVALILSAFNLGWYVTFPVFLIVSIILLFAFRSLAIKKLNKGVTKLNADSAIGKETTLLSDIAFGQSGTVKINDVVWTAVAKNDKTNIKKGAVVKIIEINGNKFIVEEV